MTDQLQPADVTALLGDLHAGKVAAIIASGTTPIQLQHAYYLAEVRPGPAAIPVGPVGRVYRILTADDELWSVGIDE